ncbi:MAG: hypothetical protein IKF42_12675 [Mogibacterium sp.]|nr:hypothetical protein [Mogibacterium sp.]
MADRKGSGEKMKRTAKTLALILAAVMIFAMFPVTASAASGKPGKVTITSFKIGKVSPATNMTTVSIRWKRASNATGYWVYQRNQNGKWEVLKKLGKNYIGINISQVRAGQNAFKVRAVRKSGKKIYKGSFSKVKSKFIASPLNLEQLARVEGERTEYSEVIDGITVNVSIKYNNIKMTYALTGDGSNKPDDARISNFFLELENHKSEYSSMCRAARVEEGIKGVSVTVALSYNGEELKSVTYTE